eukprot:TRINITY_DN10567_c0_g1_i12.p1 TRINITY_DN10567_c0_g1~~TRINITY_DN10567_c0_g1_i12.p1  ORF type:complete len:362 (+),score=72.36 TRINITY_DN10567_c0_g1_i12:52-1137(+)
MSVSLFWSVLSLVCLADGVQVVANLEASQCGTLALTAVFESPAPEPSEPAPVESPAPEPAEPAPVVADPDARTTWAFTNLDAWSAWLPTVRIQFFSDESCSTEILTDNTTATGYTVEPIGDNWCGDSLRAFTNVGNTLSERSCAGVHFGAAGDYYIGVTYNEPVTVNCVKIMRGFECHNHGTPVDSYRLLKTNTPEVASSWETVQDYCGLSTDDYCCQHPSGSGQCSEPLEPAVCSAPAAEPIPEADPSPETDASPEANPTPEADPTPEAVAEPVSAPVPETESAPEYKWYRGDTTDPTTAVEIPGESNTTYFPTIEDDQKYLFFEVVATGERVKAYKIDMTYGCTEGSTISSFKNRFRSL